MSLYTWDAYLIQTRGWWRHFIARDFNIIFIRGRWRQTFTLINVWRHVYKSNWFLYHTQWNDIRFWNKANCTHSVSGFKQGWISSTYPFPFYFIHLRFPDQNLQHSVYFVCISDISILDNQTAQHVFSLFVSVW